MSLAVPYVLDACVQVAPDVTVTVDGRRRSVRDVERLTAGEAVRLLEHGTRPGCHRDMRDTCESPSITHLALARIGAVLCDESSCPDRSRTLGEDVPALDVLQTRVWSAVPLVHSGDALLTHGDYLGALAARGHEAGPRALAVLVSDLIEAGRSRPRQE